MSSSRKLLTALVLALATANVALAARSRAEVARDIGNKVYCMCGCVTSLAHCPHENCPVKAEEYKIINTDLKEGKTEPAIFQDLVDRYGEKVLAAPPPHGFNLTAWLLPGFGLIVGLLLALTVVRRWRHPAPAPAAPSAPVDPNLQAAVEEEMKRFVD